MTVNLKLSNMKIIYCYYDGVCQGFLDDGLNVTTTCRSLQTLTN